jgi:enoyl-CoA hydratase/carnithine racemase
MMTQREDKEFDIMSGTDKMLSRKEGGVGYVTFNNPERLNAVSLDMWDATKRILDGFAADNDIRVIVLTGAGGKAFVSGADISKFESERANLESSRAYSKRADAAYSSIYEFPKPTIAMIRGYCIGGGLGLATCCDLRIATDNSRFAVPAAKLGIGYGYVGLKRLTDIVGPAFAKEIFYTARQFDAQEALAMGLINRAVPTADLETYVKSITDMICANAPLTIKAVKYTVGEILKDDDKRNVARTVEMVETCYGSRDFTEGRTAFMEKRKPVFTGT